MIHFGKDFAKGAKPKKDFTCFSGHPHSKFRGAVDPDAAVGTIPLK